MEQIFVDPIGCLAAQMSRRDANGMHPVFPIHAQSIVDIARFQWVEL